MTTLATTSLSSPADRRDSRSGPFADIRGFWSHFFARAVNPYRPELHYMRGPGPACRAKQVAISPAVQSMIVEIRAAKSLRQPARS
jgi:hypothetical protein